MALNILKGYSFAERDNADTVHKQLEAMKLAFADGNRYVADLDYMKAPVETLLSDEYADGRRALIGEQALTPEPGNPFRGGTIYLCTADGEGNMVSYIQVLHGIWIRDRNTWNRDRAAEPRGELHTG